MRFSQSIWHGIINLESSFHEDFKNGLTFPKSGTLRGVIAILSKWALFMGHPEFIAKLRPGPIQFQSKSNLS